VDFVALGFKPNQVVYIGADSTNFTINHDSRHMVTAVDQHNLYIGQHMSDNCNPPTPAFTAEGPVFNIIYVGNDNSGIKGYI